MNQNPFLIYKDLDQDKHMSQHSYDIETLLMIIGYSDKSNKTNQADIFLDVEISKVSWEPFVVINSELKFYQRDFCWDLNDKKLFIESLYQGSHCGSIIIRKRGISELKSFINTGVNPKLLAWYDIVDGKQRLSTIIDFIQDKFSDCHGNLFSQLSVQAQRSLNTLMPFSCTFIKEDAPDSLVIRQFLKTNHTGKPQLVEHIDLVKEIYKTMPRVQTWE